MTQKIYIDDVDVCASYNVLLADGCYEGLVQWPDMKGVAGNDWQEMDGYEPDLSNPLLDSRSFILKFILRGGVASIDAFYRFLGAQPSREYYFSEINRRLTLRLESMPSVQYARTFHIVQVQVAADSPLEWFNAASYSGPSSSLPENREYVIDGTPMSAYGLRVLQGTIGSVIKGADVKPLLIRKSSAINGAIYDENPLLNDADNSFGSGYEIIGGSVEGVAANWKRATERGVVAYKGRDITLRCLLQAGSLVEAWRNYDGLLYDLTYVDPRASDQTLAGARKIFIRSLQKTFKCFYLSQRVTEFLCRNGRVWLKFDLTLSLFQEDNSGAPYLEITPRYIWVVPEFSRDVHVESNTNWAVD